MNFLIDLRSLPRALKQYGGGFDLPEKIEQLDSLEQRSADPNLWNNPEHARKLMQELSSLRETIDYWKQLRQDVSDTLELASFEDETLASELEAEADELERKLDRAEFELLFSGPHDRGDAILAIHAGAGGTDSQDWATMLL